MTHVIKDTTWQHHGNSLMAIPALGWAPAVHIGQHTPMSMGTQLLDVQTMTNNQHLQHYSVP